MSKYSRYGFVNALAMACTTALLMAALAAFPLSGLAANWYASPSGTGSGTSAGDPASLQGAINSASAASSDTVWAASGTYNAGGFTNYPAGSVLTNRIFITKAITVRSSSGNPADTIIQGNWTATTNGPGAIRCVYMSSGVLMDFTITNGATFQVASAPDGSGGGIYSKDTTSIISNCVIDGNAAYYYAGGVYYGTLKNCWLIGNAAFYGGASSFSVLTNCWEVGNSAKNLGSGGSPVGGGAYQGTLYNCIVMSNSATSSGGGVDQSTVYNSTITGNRGGSYGGGAMQATLYNCTLSSNAITGSVSGGGADSSTLYNCLVFSNTASYGGGIGSGSSASFAYNCTVVSNKATTSGAFGVNYQGGGGTYGGTFVNCIVIGNYTVGGSADGTANWRGGAFTNCCTYPGTNVVSQTAMKVGCLTNNPPQFVSASTYNFRLAKGSPCIDTGFNVYWMTNGTVRSSDLDGTPRISPKNGTVDMGAYEFAAGIFTGTSVYFR